VKINVLTLLTASFILLSSSFTFSSCKDCDKKEPEPTDRDNKTSIDDNSKTKSGDDSNTPYNPNPSPAPALDIPKPKKKLTPSQIKDLVKKVAGHVYAARELGVTSFSSYNKLNGVTITEENLQKLKVKDKEVEKIVQNVRKAEKPEDPDTTNDVNAIELLSLKMEREKKFAELLVTKAKRVAAKMAKDAADTKVGKADVKEQDRLEADRAKVEWEEAQKEERAADTEDDNMYNKWEAKLSEKSKALGIARDVFLEVAMVEGKKTKEQAVEAFEF
jgi:hypothetical protein